MRYIADFLTMGNLISGCFSIGCLLWHRLEISAGLILVSVLLDGFDGYIARKCGTAGEFGKNLDSFADMVSFGIAPVGLVFLFLFPQGPSIHADRDMVILGILVSIVYVVCSALRLSRYNVNASSSSVFSFVGLPTTISGAAVASLVLLCMHKGWVPCPYIFSCVLGGFAVLMVSRINYPNLRGIRKLFAGRKILMAICWFSLLSLTLLMGRSGGMTGLFLSGLFMIYIVFFPWLKRNFV